MPRRADEAEGGSQFEQGHVAEAKWR
jgi:hypothetical protein